MTVDPLVRTPGRHRGPLGVVLGYVLGDEPKRRTGLSRSLTASSVYFLCLAVQWVAVALGLLDASHAIWLTEFAVFGAFGFYLLIRSGATSRLRDPALTIPQMGFAIVADALAYRLVPDMRGAMPVALVLILVFGAFILPPRRCRDFGWFALLALGIAMITGIAQDPAHFDATTELFAFLIIMIIVPALAVLAGQLSGLRIAQRAQKRELRGLMDQLKTIATHDDLTGLPNRRHVQEWMTHEIARAHRQKSPLCVAIIDLDRFKLINDAHGHGAGDLALQIFAREATHGLRAGDVLARWGGEEFLLVMRDSTIPDAQAALERLRAHLARPETWRDCPHCRVTFSAGLTTLGHPQKLEDALRAADLALYEAKDLGRDRVITTEPLQPLQPGMASDPIATRSAISA